MIKRLSIDRMIPKLMRVFRFYGPLTIKSIHKYTLFGKASIRLALESMVDNGLLAKNGERPTIYELTSDSKHWLGWDKSFN